MPDKISFFQRTYLHAISTKYKTSFLIGSLEIKKLPHSVSLTEQNSFEKKKKN